VRTGRCAGQFWAFLAAKLPKMGDFLPWTPMNRRAKFDATSFIHGEQIHKSTNTQTKLQTVTDISTFCLSARVDN